MAEAAAGDSPSCTAGTPAGTLGKVPDGVAGSCPQGSRVLLCPVPPGLGGRVGHVPELPLGLPAWPPPQHRSQDRPPPQLALWGLIFCFVLFVLPASRGQEVRTRSNGGKQEKGRKIPLKELAGSEQRPGLWEPGGRFQVQRETVFRPEFLSIAAQGPESHQGALLHLRPASPHLPTKPLEDKPLRKERSRRRQGGRAGTQPAGWPLDPRWWRKGPERRPLERR